MATTSRSDPPFEARYEQLFSNSKDINNDTDSKVVRECELPMIDLRSLASKDEAVRKAGVAEIARASSEWGFFQVRGHGISTELLKEMRRQQEKLFGLPFEEKASSGILDGSYRWGTPTAATLKNFSWSEAFHVPLAKLTDEDCCGVELKSLRCGLGSKNFPVAEESSILVQSMCMPDTFFLALIREMKAFKWGCAIAADSNHSWLDYRLTPPLAE